METVADLYERNASHFPDRTAYVDERRRVSHGELLVRIRKLASAIEKSGARRQHRMGIFSTNNIEYYELYGACEYAGFIIANYNFRSVLPELQYVVSDSAPSLLFFETSFTPLIGELRAQGANILRYICIGGSAPDWATDYETFIAEGDSAGPSIRVRPNDYSQLFYTSGTTGKPKGVPIQNAPLLITAERGALEEDLNVLQISPAFHIGGRGFGLGAFWGAGKVVLQGSFDATRFLEAIQDERISMTFMVPPMIQAVLDHPDFHKFDLSSLRWVMAASTKIPLPLLKRASEMIGPAFYIAYGSTEGAGITRMKRADLQPDGSPESLKRLESVGQFEQGVDGAILDEEGRPCPTGTVGEVCVKSHSFCGYWNNTVATLEAMHGDYLRTGDLGYIDERGYVFLVDRKKDMIISGGENIYSREVEDALQLHPAVYETAVIGQPDPKWGEAVCAIIVLKPGASATESELMAFAQTRIARFKCPRRILFLPEMPRNAASKIDKVVLRNTYGRAPGGS